MLLKTGLYSAVLTAFVVVSFTQLQEDTAAESLKVLRLIANQTTGGVALSGQLSNSTATPFQPSITAIRVNILWFASLVISLSTASFAILVKQWLRAYMAFTSTSPQGQMRIRHFRRSGLDTWRVLGIASMLPLFIQISLALFFVGLCFFTVDIHPAIGNTTIPLVGAWAFLLIASTLSPIFSSRCPFKTPALAPFTTALRTFVYVPIIMPWIHPGRLVYALFNCGFFAVRVLLVLSLYPLRKVNLVNRKAMDGFWEAIHTIIHAGLHRYELKPSECKEEKDVSRDSSRDLMILTSADTIQDNPELDSTALEATLDQLKPHWSEAIKLLVRIIGTRIPLPAFEEEPEGGHSRLKTSLQEDTRCDSTSFSPSRRFRITRRFRSRVCPTLPGTCMGDICLSFYSL